MWVGGKPIATSKLSFLIKILLQFLHAVLVEIGTLDWITQDLICFGELGKDLCGYLLRLLGCFRVVSECQLAVAFGDLVGCGVAADTKRLVIVSNHAL